MNKPIAPLTAVPAGEHEVKSTVTDDGYVFDHIRTASPIFTKMEREARAANTRCCITGQLVDVQYHHKFCEYSLAYMVDWHVVKGIAMGTVKELPVLDIDTHQPVASGDTWPVEGSKVWEMIQICRLVHGYDWNKDFDPDHPETFVDHRVNMDPLNVRYHIGDRGEHHHTGPYLGGYRLPRKAGVVYAPNEQAIRAVPANS